MWYRSLIAFALLLLIGAAINPPLAIHGTRVLPVFAIPPTRSEMGPEAETEGWPIRPPTPWPAVTDWSQDVRGAAVYQSAWSRNQAGQTTHQMQVEFYGWPLPSLRHAILWSTPDHSPRYVPPPGAAGANGMSSGPGTGTDYRDTGLQLHWPGVILNPLLFAVLSWLLLVAPIAIFLSARRALRVRRGRCPACSYPVGATNRCTECGCQATSRPA